MNRRGHSKTQERMNKMAGFLSIFSGYLSVKEGCGASALRGEPRRFHLQDFRMRHTNVLLLGKYCGLSYLFSRSSVFTSVSVQLYDTNSVQTCQFCLLQLLQLLHRTLITSSFFRSQSSFITLLTDISYTLILHLDHLRYLVTIDFRLVRKCKALCHFELQS